MRPQLIFLIPALVFFLYGILIFCTGSGTLFFLVWFLLGGAMVILSQAHRLQLLARLPVPLRILFAAAAAVLLLLFLFVEAMILGGARQTPEENAEYIIVLGAQVREGGPSVVLRYRLDRAVSRLREDPDTLCIVSGGQGYNEPYPEAEGMRDYLLEQGIDPSRILMEPQSSNTRENLAFSAQLLDKETARVGIVTNDFHMFRALAIARKQGYAHAFGIPAASSRLYLPNNLLREFLGVVKDRLAGNI